MNEREYLAFRRLLVFNEQLKADLERTRFFAWALAGILFATTLTISTVK